jgi:pimeloyl-ACP methyl ester carboxylesterase
MHGLSLLPSSWDRWAEVFEAADYTALTPGWPDEPYTVVEEANAHPEVFAHKSVGQVADHYAEVIGRLEKKPAIIGHSLGGLLVQMFAGRGFAAATVAIDPDRASQRSSRCRTAATRSSSTAVGARLPIRRWLSSGSSSELRDQMS